MKEHQPLGLKVPIIYVNPPFHTGAGLIEAVYRSGGLGIVDHFAASKTDSPVTPNVPHGVRISLDQLAHLSAEKNVALALIPLEDADKLASMGEHGLKDSPVPVFVEVGSPDQASAADRAGAAGLIARGSEGPGWVSETNGFVLLQEVLSVTSLPVFLRGGIGLHTAPGAVAAGAAGVVFDNQLLLTRNSQLDEGLKKFLASLSSPATVTLSENSKRPCRVYSRIGTRMVRELHKLEKTLTGEQFAGYEDKIN
ncbi:nitronate monooxygenase, partial [Thermodesulfobacteriota bacterium]